MTFDALRIRLCILYPVSITSITLPGFSPSGQGIVAIASMQVGSKSFPRARISLIPSDSRDDLSPSRVSLTPAITDSVPSPTSVASRAFER